MEMKPKYYLNSCGQFVIENYNYAKPFSSFFPGIAGIWGIPMWVFYANRGQCITSFGIKDKDHPIMEFQPANKAYQQASILGFRTFLKVKSGKRHIFYDAFQNNVSSWNFDIENKMFIDSHELKLKEINHTLGIELEVEYFTIPSDNYGALVRKLQIRNLNSKEKEIDILDGMPKVIPYGLTNLFLKELPRTIEAWMGVENLDKNIPYIRVKVDPADRPEVVHVTAGHFYLSFNDNGLLKPIVDPEEIFGSVSDFTYPQNFLRDDKFSYPKNQMTRGRTPCSIVHQKIKLKAKAENVLYSLIGNMNSLEKLNANAKRIADKDYILNKQKENRELICELKSKVSTHSSSKTFDLYCEQNFLDNCMRGGYPLSLNCGLKDIPIQVYSRKHGDPERDYNKFLLEPTYFSQGNGNFRDVNQNRRSDIWFNPQVKDASILNLFNLIQSDGYNPLVIKPDNFVFNKNYKAIDNFLNQHRREEISIRLSKPFTPGDILFFIEQHKIKLLCSNEEFLKTVLENSVRLIEAEHGEGFWIDHWTYCLDILEAYLGFYPENLKDVLIENKEFTFFDNAEYVRPRKEKYFLKDGHVFQYHAIANSHTKHNLIKKRSEFPHVIRTENGKGQIYKTTLFVKMLTVIANKFATLDPFGCGIEMEADKPNWYDSLNGLPGLLGSAVCETFELKRWITFLKESLKNLSLNNDYSFILPLELHDFLIGLKDILGENLGDYGFWDKTHTLKEDYRDKTLMGYSGSEKKINVSQLNEVFESFIAKIDLGLKKSYNQKHKLSYSYFINEAVEYEVISATEHTQLVKVLKFKQKPMPLFLEGIMHSLRVIDTKDNARKVFKAVRKSPLYDNKLKMYKINSPLYDMPEEIGRCRVFVPGWLENESVWLHMEYKYILELLKNGLYEEFYDDFKNVLIPFLNPERYGRSILENSSFLVSSVFPKKELHGNGFVARLSGSTAEFISIWLFMCLGERPFYLKDGKLLLELKPVLPGWLFSKKQEGDFAKNTFAFKFLDKTLIVYHNPKRKDTFGKGGVSVKKITLKTEGSKEISLETSCIDSKLASDVRSGKFKRIDIILG